jgi:hypothetical protein
VTGHVYLTAALRDVFSDGFWDRDGWLALNTEGLPLIGFITASIQNITDNEARAIRKSFLFRDLANMPMLRITPDAP